MNRNIKAPNSYRLVSEIIRLLNVVIKKLELNRTKAGKSIRYELSPYYYDVIRLPDIKIINSNADVRLNVVLPTFDESACYGGIISALEIVSNISKHYNSIRFISLDTLKQKNIIYLDCYVANRETKFVSQTSLADSDSLCCGINEIFLCTYYTTVSVWESYVRTLREHGYKINRYYYIIQDYEPGFTPFGYLNSLALKSYDHSEYTFAIFNSIELYEYFKARGYTFSAEKIIYPSVNTVERDYLASNNYNLKTKGDECIEILLYGRPKHSRNCFQSIIAGLYEYFVTIPVNERTKYVVKSVGFFHEDIELCDNVVVKCLGKLTIENYIKQLEVSHIGISLMASPHPSYPPLEMAIFGLYTITNKFFSKTFNDCHEMIHAIDYPLPSELAQELRNAVAYVIGNSNKYIKATIPKNMSDLSWGENLSNTSIDKISGYNH